MRFPALLLVFAALLAGCSSPQEASKPNAESPAPPQGQSSTPAEVPSPETTSTAPKASEPAPVVKAPPASSESPLATYGQKLWIVLGARDIAEREWNDEVRKSATELDKKGLAALLGPYRGYAKSVARTAEALKALRPPQEAKDFHATIEQNVDRLNENLESMVEALENNDGQAAVALSEERKKIQASGGDEAKAALERAGFDVKRYLAEHVLVRKE